MKRTIFAAAAVTASLTVLAESPLWLRNAALSPDGKTLAFTYKGDIWSVPVTGGQARQLTTNPSYDTAPMWSPDGKSLVFVSDRATGSPDIFVIPAGGGTATRLTTDSGAEFPLTWLSDSTLLIRAAGEGSATALLHPSAVNSPLYTININRPDLRPRFYAHVAMQAADADAAGRVLYQDRKGFENQFRKHERSSATHDIWLKDGNKYTKLTDFNGNNDSPLWVDANSYVYLSEKDGTLNIWLRSLDGKTDRQLTDYRDFPVRSLTRADNGLLAYSWNGELYTLQPGGRPQKVEVTLVADDYDRDLQKRIMRSGATSMTPSPDGKEVAFVLRGDVYVTSVEYKTTKRITNTPGQERVVDYAPDGRTLVYDSERDGQWGLYQTKIKNAAEKSFAYATELVEEPLYVAADGKPAQQPAYSPDGKKVGFLRDRVEVCVIDPATKAVTTALDGKYNYSYSDGDVTFAWSPDSKWFLTSYIGIGGWNNTDIALVKADGSQVVDLTESGYSDGNPRWAMGGRAVTYQTGRYGMRSHGSWGETTDVVVMMLDGDAWDEIRRTEEDAALAKEQEKEKKDAESGDKDKKDKKSKKDKKKDAKADEKKVKDLEFDLDNRHFRTARLTNMSGYTGDYYLSEDGSTLYYTTMNADGSSNLMSRNLRKGDVKVLVPGLRGGFEPDAKGENLFVISGSGLCKVSLPDGKKTDIEFEAPYDRHPSLEREYIYDHMVSQVADKFHDVNMHGADWKKVGKDYRRFLPYIDNGQDFAILMSEALGELNASHTGSGYTGGGASMSTGRLGAFFDPGYEGEGLRITEVIARGPLSAKKYNVKPGDIILAIDGETIAPGADYNRLLEGKVRRNVRLTMRRADGKTDDITVKPAGSLSSQLYERWVERNEKYVDSISGGRIAYVHIQGMNSPSFREVYSKLLGKYRNREAVVVDTRWNGGGWLHNDVALLLNGKEYVRYTPRGKYVGSDPFSQWTKPSAMLVNESNYSDAHGTPYVYQTLKIGDVVGAPVPGTMTAVWWETQIDPDIYFGIPQVTSLDRNGEPLENKQLNPDIEVYNNPADVQAGRDVQLETAVRSLMDKLDK